MKKIYVYCAFNASKCSMNIGYNLIKNLIKFVMMSKSFFHWSIVNNPKILVYRNRIPNFDLQELTIQGCI